MNTLTARRPRICLLAIAAACLTRGVLAIQQPAPNPNALTVTAPPDTFAVTMTVTLYLYALHPAATQGGLQCGAKASISSELTTLQAAIQADARQMSSTGYDTDFSSGLMSRAHYYHSDVTVSFPIVNGGYSGTQTVTMYVPYAELLNAQNTVVPGPAVLAGCWLTINGKPAILGRDREVATANNINHVATSGIVAVQVVPVSSQ